MNFKNKLIKEFEEKPLHELVSAPLYALQGLSKKDAVLLEKAFNIKTVRDLAGLKFYTWAREICSLADFDVSMSEMAEFKDKLIKKYEKKKPKDLVRAPVNALQGLSKKDADLLNKAFRIKTLKQFANLKYIQWANEIVDMERHASSRKKKKGEGGSLLKFAGTAIVLGCILFLVFFFVLKKKEQVSVTGKEKVKKSSQIVSGRETGNKAAGKQITEFKPINTEKKAEVITKYVEKKSEVSERPVKDDPYQYYTVQRGDKMTSISVKLYGTYKKWKKIYRDNKNLIKNPNMIHPGLKLVIRERTDKK